MTRLAMFFSTAATSPFIQPDCASGGLTFGFKGFVFGLMACECFLGHATRGKRDRTTRLIVLNPTLGLLLTLVEFFVLGIRMRHLFSGPTFSSVGRVSGSRFWFS
jgi:hypothetical protein